MVNELFNPNRLRNAICAVACYLGIEAACLAFCAFVIMHIRR